MKGKVAMAKKKCSSQFKAKVAIEAIRGDHQSVSLYIWNSSSPGKTLEEYEALLPPEPAKQVASVLNQATE